MTGLYAIAKTGDGTPIVLLHGFGASSAAWLPIMEGLGERSLIAYDLPGHGASLGYPNAGSPGTAAKAIIADLEERGTDKAHFCGHSMGGAIATLIALMKPELVASLTLLAPGGYGAEINSALLRRYGSAAEAEEIADCLKEMSGPNAHVSRDVAERMAAQRRVEGQIAMLEKIAAMITRDDRQGVLPADSVRALAIPVTAIWGTEDSILPFSQMEAMPANWRKIAVPQAGHMLMEEAPDTVRQVLREQAI